MTHDNSAAIPRRTYTAADGRTVELIGKPSEELMARVLKKLIDSELRRRAEAECLHEKSQTNAAISEQKICTDDAR